MTRCSGLKKDLCSDPCMWVVKKGCTKSEGVKAAEQEAKAAAKAAKEAAAKAAKEKAAAIRAAAKASKAVKAEKEAKVKEVKAVKAVKEAKVKEAKEKAVPKPKVTKSNVVKVDVASKWKWLPQSKSNPFGKDAPVNLKTDFPADHNIVRTSITYDDVLIKKIHAHAKHMIANMFSNDNYIREICRGLFYVPSKDLFVALIRTRSTKSPKINKNNDYLGVEFTYNEIRKYKMVVNKDTIVLVEDFVGKLDRTSTEPLKALKAEYKDVIQLYDTV